MVIHVLLEDCGWMSLYLVAPMHGSKRVTVLSVNQLRITYRVFYLRNNQYTQHGNLYCVCCK